MRSNWFPVLLGAAFIAVISMPYILAYQDAGSGYKFGGFLLNPIDGNSYLAKMHQGEQGSWRFYLPYTVERGQGAFLFTFYLLLGHLARISGSSNQLIFHVFRIVGASALVASIWHFFGRVFSVQRTRKVAFGLALFGSGLGWLTSIFGIFSPDFWVAEGYAFLAAYANPHFPLGVAIMLWIMAPGASEGVQGEKGSQSPKWLITLVMSLILAIVMPFGVVITAVVLIGVFLWEMLDNMRFASNEINFSQWVRSNFEQNVVVQKLVFLFVGGVPVLLYQVWVTRSDPILAAWNAQNITLSPPIWELLLAYAPIILLAFPGIYLAIKSGEHNLRILLIWACLGFLWLYVPWSLQRRFISGYMVPLAGLAALTLEAMFSRKRLLGVSVLILVIVLMLPTNMMILMGGIQAINDKVENIYISDSDYQGMKWIDANTEEESVILASTDSGLLLPAYTGRRVWYGHPFETPDALKMETLVQELFSGKESEPGKIILQESDYLFISSREYPQNELEVDTGFELVFESGKTRIYHIRTQ